MHHVGHVDWDFSEPPAGYAGSAAGYSSSCLVGSHTGAVHTDLSVSKLEPGGWTGLHLHSFESAVYVLAGDPVLHIDGHQNQLRAGDYALLPIGMPHGWANPSGGQARLLVHSTPQRRPSGQRPGDTFFLPADSVVSGHAAPVSRYLGHYVGTPPQQEALRVDDRVRNREPAGMDTALLAYSGISVKMMVDRGLGAELLVMFMVDYEPGVPRRPTIIPSRRRTSSWRGRSTPKSTASPTSCGPETSCSPGSARPTASTTPAAGGCAGSKPRPRSRPAVIPIAGPGRGSVWSRRRPATRAYRLRT